MCTNFFVNNFRSIFFLCRNQTIFSRAFHELGRLVGYKLSHLVRDILWLKQVNGWLIKSEQKCQKLFVQTMLWVCVTQPQNHYYCVWQLTLLLHIYSCTTVWQHLKTLLPLKQLYQGCQARYVSILNKGGICHTHFRIHFQKKLFLSVLLSSDYFESVKPTATQLTTILSNIYYY